MRSSWIILSSAWITRSFSFHLNSNAAEIVHLKHTLETNLDDF